MDGNIATTIVIVIAATPVAALVALAAAFAGRAILSLTSRPEGGFEAKIVDK